MVFDFGLGVLGFGFREAFSRRKESRPFGF